MTIVKSLGGFLFKRAQILEHGGFLNPVVCVLWVLQSLQACDSVTPWTAARQDPLSMEFPREGCWRGLPFLPPGDLLDPGIKLESPASPALQVDSLLLGH